MWLNRTNRPLAIICFIYICLPVFFALCCIFGPGFQTISVCCWLYFYFGLLYTRLTLSIFSPFILGVVQLYCSWIAYYKQFATHDINSPSDEAIWSGLSFHFILRVTFGSFLCYLIDFLLYNIGYKKGFISNLQPLFFPACWTAMWWYCSSNLYTASWAMHSTALPDDSVLQLLTPIVGPFGIEFFMALSGSCFSFVSIHLIDSYMTFRHQLVSTKFSKIRDLSKSSLLIFVIFFGVFGGWGGYYLLDNDMGMWQKLPAHASSKSNQNTQQTFSSITKSINDVNKKTVVSQAPYGTAKRDGRLHYTCLTGDVNENIDSLVRRTRVAIHSFEADILGGNYPNYFSNKISDFVASDINYGMEINSKSDTSTMDFMYPLSYDSSYFPSALLPALSNLPDKILSSDEFGESLDHYPVHVVQWSELSITSILNEEDEINMLSRLSMSLKPRTILAVSFAAPPTDSSTSRKYNRQVILAYTDTAMAIKSSLHREIAEGVVQLLSTDKLMVAPNMELNTLPGDKYDHATSTKLLPPEMKSLGNVTAFICFDLDWPQSWWKIGSRGLLFNPSQTWGVEGFRFMHGAKQEIIARAMGNTLLRCSGNGLSSMVEMDKWSHPVRAYTGWGDVFKATGQQPRSQRSGELTPYVQYVLRDGLHLDLVSVIIVIFGVIIRSLYAWSLIVFGDDESKNQSAAAPTEKNDNKEKCL